MQLFALKTLTASGFRFIPLLFLFLLSLFSSLLPLPFFSSFSHRSMRCCWLKMEEMSKLMMKLRPTLTSSQLALTLVFFLFFSFLFLTALYLYSNTLPKSVATMMFEIDNKTRRNKVLYELGQSSSFQITNT